MRILVTGVNGQLGYDIIRCLTEKKIECIGADINDFDITNIKETEEYIFREKPDAVIHCAAYTQVDKAEDDKELCFDVNVNGTKNIAKICEKMDIKMLYISTDYVFPGEGDSFYEVDDVTKALSYYGLSKLEGEKVIQENLSKFFIVRISWAFGKNGNNFVKTMLRLAKEREEINVVKDQVGSPTFTADLAPLLCEMILTEKYGIYHATNEGVCTWAEFASEIFRQAGLNIKVNPIMTEEYPARALRPKNSRLSKKSLDENGFERLPDWKDALRRYLEELK